jgi:hypothetical protein
LRTNQARTRRFSRQKSSGTTIAPPGFNPRLTLAAVDKGVENMRTATTNDSVHNPFRNRFNDPVTWRLDEMQAHSNVIWLQQHDHGNHQPGSSGVNHKDFSERSTDDGGTFTGIFALFLVVLVSVIVLFKP